MYCAPKPSPCWQGTMVTDTTSESTISTVASM